MSLVKALQDLVVKAGAAVDWVEFAKAFPRLRCILEDHVDGGVVREREEDSGSSLRYCTRCRCVYLPEKTE